MLPSSQRPARKPIGRSGTAARRFNGPRVPSPPPYPRNSLGSQGMRGDFVCCLAPPIAKNPNPDAMRHRHGIAAGLIATTDGTLSGVRVL